jgi:ABC-type transporter Mla subunit MlaD
MALLVNDERLSKRVGTAVLGVTLAAIVFVVTLYDRMGGDGVEIRVYFASVTAVPEGASVQIAGNTIGVLTSVTLVRSEDAPPGHLLHGTGGIAAVALIDPEWAARIPRNADFFVSARSMFAPPYLEIGPPADRALPGKRLVHGDEVRGVDPPSLDRVLQKAWDSLEDTRRFTEAIRPASEKLSAAIARLSLTILRLEPAPGQWDAIDTEMRGAVGEGKALFAELEAGRLDLAAIERLTVRIRALAARVDGVVTQMTGQIALLEAALAKAKADLPPDLAARIEATVAEGKAAAAGAEAIIAGVRGITADVTSRRGTVGAMMSDVELLDDMKELTKHLKRRPWRVVVKGW